jgi:acyl-coenzyme A thioesterase PaaI-like protein
MDAPRYTPTTLTPEQAADHDRVHSALTRATRGLVEAQLLTEVDHDEVEDVTAEIERLTERLRKRVRQGSLGVELGPGELEVRAHGNTVSGMRNPVAVIDTDRRTVDEDRRVTHELHLGPLYEGPPGLVHGGVSALVLDQVLGEAAAVGGSPGMTGRLTVHYRRPTPLGDLTVSARLESSEGRKAIVKGELRDAHGQVTVEAEGLFILPSWASDLPELKARRRSFE